MKRIIALVVLLLCLSSFILTMVWFECDASCPHGCTVFVEEGDCGQKNPCCGWCSNDGGHTKDWCCLSCPNEPL